MGEVEESSPLLQAVNNYQEIDGSPVNTSAKNCCPKLCVACKNIKCGQYVKGYFPITNWLPRYCLAYLICDCIAGVTVGLTVIPQALAYAQIAGLPIQYGLYSSFMGGFIYCIFGTSKDVTLGPTAIMSLLVHSYGNSDPVQAVLLTLFAGIVQFAMGVFRLGFIMRYISIPVISGFTSAAAITIAFGQVKHIFGIKTQSNEFILEFIETFKNIGSTNIWDFIMGTCCIVLLMLLRNLKHTLPEENEIDSRLKKWAIKFLWFLSTGRNAVIVVCAAMTAYAISTQNVASTCRVPNCLTLTGEIKEGLPPFKPPEFSEIVGNKTITTGTLLSNMGAGLFVVPLMGLLESIAIGKSFASKGDYILHSNQEMIAIGLANIISSFVSSYSITGSFSRTAINYQSHVQTPAGGIITGFLVLLSLAFLTPLFFYIPKAALAAVIISSVVFMIDFGSIKKIWKSYKLDLIPLMLTFLLCFWEIPYGILAGVGCSLLFILYPVTWPKVEKSNKYDAINEDYVVIKLNQGAFFCSAEYIQSEVKKIVKTSEKDISKVIFDTSAVSHLDYTSAVNFVEIAEQFIKHNVMFVVTSLEYSLLCTLKSVDFGNNILFHNSLQEAI